MLPVHDSVAALSTLARAQGVSTAALALAWVMRAGPVVRPIIGPSRLSHLDDVAHAMTVRLTTEEWAAIKEVFADPAA